MSKKRDGEWDKTAEGVMLNFAESGHPVFRAKGKGVKIHSLQW